MDRWQKAILQLLRCGLWEREVDDLSLFPLSAEEWRLVCAESERQTVQGLCHRGLKYLPDAYCPPQEVADRWMAYSIAITSANEKVKHVTASVCCKLQKEGIEPVLMKGQAVAQYYEMPQLRMCGDIDLFIADSHQFESACRLLGDDHHQGADGSVSCDVNGIEVELHRQLVDIQRPSSQRLVSSLLAQEGFGSMALMDGVEIKIPSPIITLLMLNAHIMKHVFTVGIGFRQFCDLARAYHALNNHYDKSKLVRIIDDLGLAKWSTLLHGLLVDHLGLPKEELPCETVNHENQQLLRKVLSWGNFGQETKSWHHHAESHWHLKIHTGKQILVGLPFSLRLAPAETIYIVKNLIKGQFIKNGYE